MSQAPSANAGLLGGFVRAARSHPGRTALELSGASLSYEKLAAWASRISGCIIRHQPDSRPLACVLALRSVSAYTGVLGVLASGKGYVPLHPRFPPDRTQRMLSLSEGNVIVVDREALVPLEALLECNEALLIIGPDIEDFGPLAARFSRHRFVSATELSTFDARLEPPQVAADSIAYLLFTSGSTGLPKGVPVTHRNVLAYVDYAAERYQLTPEDRTSQTFDLTFDLSVHDLFVTWASGACLCCLPERTLMAPARFIRDRILTRWFSVPSVAMMMDRLRMLKPGAFPGLRTSLFCGEALPERTASSWAKAAPNTVLDNLYGPTEATIATTVYRWREPESHSECENGIVPIGWPFPRQQVAVVDERGVEVEEGKVGELYLSGPQLASGYWKDPVKTAERFCRIEGHGDSVWYCTGDLVRRAAGGCLHFVGRTDSQVQVRGHRIELQEIDGVLREAVGTDLAVTVAWPVRNGIAEGLVAFVVAAALDEAHLKAQCARQLPYYMVPSRILRIEEMPLTSSGKIDRRTLAKSLTEDVLPVG